jgi:hypothetical protein
LIQRAGEVQKFLSAHASAGGHDRGQTWPAQSKGAGLVEQHHPAGGELFQGSAAFNDDSDPRGPRQPRHDGDRRGQQQRARRGDHQHRNRADRIPTQRPRNGGQDQREWHEHDREPVRSAHERSSRRLRLLDQAHHTGVRGLGRSGGGEQVKRLTGVDDAAAHRIPDRPLNRQRLTGQRRFIQHGR